MALWIREIKRKDGSVRKVWYATVFKPTDRRYPNGKTIYKRSTYSLGDVGEVRKSVAKKKYEELKHDIAHREEKAKEGLLTIEEFAEDYINYVTNVTKKKSWKRDIQCINNVKEILGPETILQDVGPSDIEEFKSVRLSDGAAPATVNREMACFRHLINIAILQDKFHKPNPFIHIKFLKVSNNRDRILSPEEEQRLFAVLTEHQKVLVDIALNTGMRANELINLKWEYVDFEHETIKIPLTHIKGQFESKQIDMNTYLKKLLKKQHKETGHQEYVALTPDGTPYKSIHSLKFFKRACERAGIEGVTFHTLRHTVITRLLAEGSGLDATARIAGHRNISTTMLYTHKNPADKVAVNKLNKYRKNIKIS